MAWWVWLVVVVVVVAGVLVAVAVDRRRKQQRRTAALRDRFGPEYDRVIAASAGRRQGEAELERRLERREQLQLREPPDGVAYSSEWRELEAQFEEAPLPAIARADALATTVLADLGYPMESFDQRAADLSVDYPEAVEHYRRAHAAYRAADDGKATREDLYEALQHYRALLDQIGGGGFTGDAVAVGR